MNRIKSWWHGQVTIEETPYVNFTIVKKPWLRTAYEKHENKVWMGVWAMVSMAGRKILEKLF